MSDGPAGVRGTSWTGAASASFPCGTALGATWDPALVEQVGRALGREAHAKSAHVLLAPDGEPAPHADRRPQLRVLQRGPGAHGRASPWPTSAACSTSGVAACIKHFVGNDTEFERMTISSEIDERTLRELYLVPFEAAVRRAGVRSIMTGYNRLNGTFCSEHPWLLADVLRGEWGFDGAVDQRLVRQPQRRRVAAGRARPGDARTAARARQAPARRRRAPARCSEARARPGRGAGCWRSARGPAPASTGTAEVTADDPETRAVIRRAATRAMVLLKNERRAAAARRRRRRGSP